MRFIKNTLVINGTKVSFWEKNHQRKSVMVFLHGFPGSHGGLIEMANRFPNHRLLIPDLPACGASEPLQSGHSLKRYAIWLNDFLNAVAVDHAIIIGHSFGARVALRFSLNHPEKTQRLVLIAPVMTVDSFIGGLASLYYKFGNKLPGYLQNAWSNNAFYRNVGNVVIYRSSCRKRLKYMTYIDKKDAKDIDGRDAIQVFNDFCKHPSISVTKKFNVKTLLIVGEKDEIATPGSVKRLLKKLANAEIRIIKKSGHHVTLERPKALGTIVHGWLK